MQNNHSDSRSSPCGPSAGRHALAARFLAWDATGSLPRLFLLLGCPLGLLFAFLVAPLQVPDEMAHLYRAYALSGGSCLAPLHLTVPAALSQLQDAFPPNVEAVRSIHFRDYLALLHPPRQGGEVQIANVSANIYNCAPYLLSGAGVAIARLFAQPPIVLFFAARLRNLAFYLALVYVALRIIPAGRLTLFGLALMPMTLHQAASVSADSPAFATAFLFFAYVLYLALDPRLSAVSTRRFATAGALLLFASLCKFNLWFCLLLLLIPAARLGSLQRKLLAIALVCGAILLAAALCQFLNRPNLAAFAAARARDNIFPPQNAAFILHQPLAFAGILLRTWQVKSSMYAIEFVGTLGWLAIDVPDWLVFSWFALLAATALFAAQMRLTLAQRALCALTAIAAFVSVFVLLWTIELRQEHLLADMLGSPAALVPAVQGRYFITLAPPLLLALSGRRMRVRPAIPVAICAAFVLVSAAVALTRVFEAYY